MEYVSGIKRRDEQRLGWAVSILTGGNGDNKDKSLLLKEIDASEKIKEGDAIRGGFFRPKNIQGRCLPGGNM